MNEKAKCQTCGGKGRIFGMGENFETDSIQCPKCQPKPKPECETCGGSGVIEQWVTDKLCNTYPCPDCQAKPIKHIECEGCIHIEKVCMPDVNGYCAAKKPKPEQPAEGEWDEVGQPSSEFVAKMWKHFYEWCKLAPHKDTILDYVLSGYQKALNVIEEQITKLEIKESSCKIFEVIIKGLKTDIERLEAEKTKPGQASGELVEELRALQSNLPALGLSHIAKAGFVGKAADRIEQLEKEKAEVGLVLAASRKIRKQQAERIKELKAKEGKAKDGDTEDR